MKVVSQSTTHYRAGSLSASDAWFFRSAATLYAATSSFSNSTQIWVFPPARDSRIRDLEVCRNFTVAFAVERHLASRKNPAF